MLVLLWDIDGTLLTTARAGIRAWESAVREVCGHAVDLDSFGTAGHTDWNIALDLLEHVGEARTDARAELLVRAYERALPDALHTRQGGVLPGVEAVLDALHAGDAGSVSVLLTGNTPAGARAKLSHYGLAARFPDTGGFCEGPGARSDIAERAVAIARQRAGTGFSAERTYVIGDTPHDISCGKAVGARTVAVATGGYTAEQLAGHDPWLVLERLPEPARFLELLTA